MDKEALSAFLDRWAEENHIAGYSACVFRRGEVLFARGHGQIDPEGKRSPDPDTVYGIGSLSKSMTALCACILAAEGRLDPDAPAVDFLPEFRFPLQKGTVTVRHLMAHTSGLPPMEALEWCSVMNTPGRALDREDEQLLSLAPSRVSDLSELLACIAACPYPPVGAPGQRFSYSNEGYALLSYIVDRAAGMPLEDFMRERIFLPLGMARSLLDGGTAASRRMAAGNFPSLFTWDGTRQLSDDSWTILPPYRGCAMVKSTARDLARYYAALSDAGLAGGRQAIPEAAVRMLVSDGVPAREIPAMCLGINRRLHGGHVICDHGGALHGLSAKGAFLWGEGVGFALLTNQDSADLDSAMWAMENAVTGRPLQESHEWFHPSAQPCPRPQRFAGDYQGHEGLTETLSVSITPSGLTAERRGKSLPLVYCGETRFLARDSQGRAILRLTFHPEGDACDLVSVGSRIFRRAK